MSRRSSRPASSGSTAPTCSTPPAASAAIAKAASAAKAAAKACSNIWPQSCRSAPAIKPRRRHAAPAEAGGRRTASIDRTAKLFIGGKQVRPDGNYSLRRARPQGPAGRRGRSRQPQGHPRRRLGCARLQGLAGGDRLQPQPGALLSWPRTCPVRADEFAARLARTDRRRRQGRARRGRAVDRAAVRLMPAWPTSSRAASTSRRPAP